MAISENSDIKPSLHQLRVAEFKSDPEKMIMLNEFLEEMCEKAKIEAEIRGNTTNNKSKNKFEVFKIQGGSRKIGIWSNRARTSARTFATRVFTAICNCSTTVRNATTAVINRSQ